MKLTRQQIEELLAQHEPMIWWIARRTLGKNANIDDIEDCAAEVRLQFVRAAQRYDPGRGVQFNTYVYRLAIYHASRWKQRQKRRGVHVPRRLGAICGPRVINLEASKLRNCLSVNDNNIGKNNEEKTAIWKILAQVLSSQQLELLRMRYQDRMFFSTIATKKGCTASNIQHLTSKILARVRRLAPELAQHLE
jgi:RNA polymerase sigma factor (sigma-70 family)